MGTFSTIAISALTGAAAAGAVVAVSFVELQAGSPGTPQTGHLNISGYALAGRVGVGVNPTLARVEVNEGGTLQGVRALTQTGVAIYGQSNATTGLGAGGYFTSSSAGGRALVAEQYSTSGPTVGGLFYSRSSAGIAGYGKAISLTGTPTGLLGETLANGGVGVKAVNNSSGNNGTALLATNSSPTDGMAAIVAQNTLTDNGWGRGLHVKGGSTDGDAMLVECDKPNQANSYAIKAVTDGTSGRGVYAYTTDSNGTNYGVYGETASPTNGFGVFSNGNTGASGTKSMVIDDPRDPANSVLKQYCAEGAEPTLIYSGTVRLNANGAAMASLPDYFDSIAANPRYSLTAVGSAMPNLHIGAKAVNGRFQIAGGAPNGEVSWTVFATRNDPWVKAYGAQTTVAKPASERGHYITPQLYGQRASKKMGLQPAERQRLLKEEAISGPK